jgi:hypothetical protein
MTNFKERTNPTTVTKALLSSVPTVFISNNALTKMHHYVDQCNDEIGWLGTAYMEGHEIIVEDVFLFDQEVHSTTTEITPQGLADFATNLLMKENGMETWNNMRVWGHSHVRMGVTPSGQDDKQMETFKDGGHEWFLRIIANKNGELKIDLYHYGHGIIYLDLPWEIQETEAELLINEKIQRLFQELDALRASMSDQNADEIKAEMEQKVKKKSYTTTTWQSKTSSTSTGQTNTKTELASTEKKNTDVVNANGSNRNANATILKNYDFFENDDEVREEINFFDLCDIGKSENFGEVEEALWSLGYFNYFTDNDIERIMRVAFKCRSKLQGGTL